MASLRVKVGASLILGIAVLLALLRWLDLGGVLRSIRSASPLWLLMSGLMYLLFFIFRSVRWRLILSHLDGSLRLGLLLQVTLLGFFVNALIPLRIGELLRAFLLGKGRRLGFFRALSSVVAERVLDLFSIAVIAAVALYFLPLGVEVSPIFLEGLRVSAAVSILLLAMVIVGSRWKEKALSAVCWAVSHIPRLPDRWKERIGGSTLGLLEGVEGISSSSSAFFSVLALSIGTWLIQASSYMFSFKAFSTAVPLTVIVVGGMIMNLSFILPAAPGYIGTFEAFWGLVFLGLGLKLEEAIPVGLALHLVWILFLTVSGLTAAGWMGIDLGELVLEARRMPEEGGGGD